MHHIDERPYIEVFDSEASFKMSPHISHALVEPACAEVLQRCAGERGFAGTEWHFRLGAVDETKTLFVPDVAYISSERLYALPQEHRAIPAAAPDIAVEIRSPGDRAVDPERKIARYLACGTMLVLDVDPATRKLHAHAPSGVRSFSKSDRFMHPAMPWLSFDVAEIFAKLDRFEAECS